MDETDNAHVIPPEALRAREMYASNAPIRDILAETGMTHFGLYRWVDGGPRVCGKPLLAMLPRRRLMASRRMRDGERNALIARLMRTTERQIDDIDAQIGVTPDTQDDVIRKLSALSRLLRDLASFENHSRMPKQARTRTTQDEGAAGAVPTDIEQLRRDLSKRLDRLVAETADSPSGQPERG